MWKEMLLLNGTIESKDGQKIKSDELFQLLSDKGYEYEGGVEIIKREDLDSAIKQIVGSFNADSLNVMTAKIKSLYGDMNEEDIKNFFIGNFGTGSFDTVLESALTKETARLYKKYTDANWQISDTFGSALGQSIVDNFFSKDRSTN